MSSSQARGLTAEEVYALWTSGKLEKKADVKQEKDDEPKERLDQRKRKARSKVQKTKGKGCQKSNHDRESGAETIGEMVSADATLAAQVGPQDQPKSSPFGNGVPQQFCTC